MLIEPICSQRAFSSFEEAAAADQKCRTMELPGWAEAVVTAGKVAAAVDPLMWPFILGGCADGYEGSKLSTETWKVKPLTEKLTATAKTNEEKTAAVVRWAEKNFFHYQDFGGADVYTTEIYGDNDERHGGLHTISIDDIFRERAVGCHFASGVIITMLRSVGIAADYVKIDGHGLTYIPSIDRYIHGDFVADLVCIPAEELLLREDELDYWLDHPGFQASELGGDPSIGVVSPGYYAFEETMRQKYGSHSRLLRGGDTLYVYGDFVGTPNEFNILSDECFEYGLTVGEADFGTAIFSDRITIQGIDELQFTEEKVKK